MIGLISCGSGRTESDWTQSDMTEFDLTQFDSTVSDLTQFDQLIQTKNPTNKEFDQIASDLNPNHSNNELNPIQHNLVQNLIRPIANRPDHTQI